MVIKRITLWWSKMNWENVMILKLYAYCIATCTLHNYIWAVLCAKSSQLCPTLCDPMYCGPPGSFAHGILQAAILEEIAVSSSMGSSQPRDQTLEIIFYVSCIGRGVLSITSATWDTYIIYKRKINNSKLNWKSRIIVNYKKIS